MVKPFIEYAEKAVDSENVDARAKLSDRIRNSQRLNGWMRHFIESVKLLSYVLMLCAVLGLCGYVMFMNGVFGEFSQRHSEYQFKHCIVKFPSGETIGGQRRLLFPSVTVFGFKIIDTAKVTEETFVTNEGNAVTGVSKSGDAWSTKVIGVGTFSTELIEKADTFTFIRNNGKDVAVIGYREFCR